jgi:hypothetical protein
MYLASTLSWAGTGRSHVTPSFDLQPAQSLRCLLDRIALTGLTLTEMTALMSDDLILSSFIASPLPASSTVPLRIELLCDTFIVSTTSERRSTYFEEYDTTWAKIVRWSCTVYQAQSYLGWVIHSHELQNFDIDRAIDAKSLIV